MRVAAFIVTVFLAVSSLSAGAKDVDLRRYGAKGDGKTKVTEKLQKAIDEVSAAGGGRVILSGGIFLTAPIELKSGVELHIDADAVLLASPDIADYPERENPKHYLSEAMPRFRNAAVIYADEAENIAISGRGTIDCNGKAHVKKKSNPDWKGWEYERIYPRRESLPRVVFFAGCRNVSVTDVTMTNQPAGWSYWIHDCDFVKFDRVNILADVHYPNNDGIHINCSRDVAVSNCFIETGDDSIVIRANSRSLRENKACERVVITNCTLHSWSTAIRLGFTNDGTVRDCTISNIVIFDSCRGIACQCPALSRQLGNESNDYGREPTVVENVSVSNVQMNGIYGNAIEFNVARAEGTLFGGFRNITFSDVVCRNAVGFPYFSGREDAPVENIVFNNCYFEKVPAESLPLEYSRHGAPGHKMPGDELNMSNIVFNNTRFVVK